MSRVVDLDQGIGNLPLDPKDLCTKEEEVVSSDGDDQGEICHRNRSKGFTIVDKIILFEIGYYE